MNKSIEVLQKFQDWRTGKDERTMKEAGLHPGDITAAIDDVIGMHVGLVLMLIQLQAEGGLGVARHRQIERLLEKTK